METLAELEKVAVVAMATPSEVSQEDRQKAEQVLLSFRKSPQPYATCQFILENSRNDYVLFEATNTIREAILREWSDLERSLVEGIFTFLLEYVMHRKSLQGFVREQIVQLLAIIIKRGSLSTTQELKANLLHSFEHIVNSGDKDMLLVCCSLMKAFLTEYSTTKESSSVGLSLEAHCNCKLAFETEDLLRIFLLATQVLRTFMDVKISSLSKTDIVILQRYLSVAEQTLSWRFGFVHVITKSTSQLNSETSVVTLFRPPGNWKQAVLSPSLPELFFKLLGASLDQEDISHLCLQCLEHLATLSGRIVNTHEVKKCYLSNYLSKGFLQFLRRPQWSSLEALGCATIASRLFFVFAVSDFIGLPNNHCKELTSLLAERTIQFQDLAAVAENNSADDNKYQEALDDLLNVWVVLISKAQIFSDGYFIRYAVNIFNAYLKAHLAPPEGSRVSIQNGNEDIECDIEEDDKVAYSDTLDNIGLLGRQALPHTLAVLCDLFTSRLQVLGILLQNLKQGNQQAAQTDTDLLFEDIHWLLLISTHLLTLYGPGETPTVPSEVVKYSAYEFQNGRVNLDSTVHFLLSCESVSSDEGVDKVVQLVANVFHLAKMEMFALQNGLTAAFSPEVASSMLSFFQRWTESYLLPERNIESEINDVLVATFRSPNGCAKQLVGTLLDLCEVNFKWTGELTVTDDAVQLFLQLVKNETRCAIALTFQNIWRIANEFFSHKGIISCVPPNSLRRLVQALVTTGTTVADTQANHIFLSEFLVQLKERYTSVRHRPNFHKIAQNEDVKLEIVTCIESFRGMALATNRKNQDKLNEFLHPLLEDSIIVLKEYNDFAEIRDLILELFLDAVQSQLCYLDKEKSERLLHVCLLLVQTYAKFSAGKKTIVALEEDEQFTDLMLLINIFARIISKDMFDLSNDKRDCSTAVADTVICGLGAIIPLMTVELLKFPNLSNEYFQLLSFVCEKYPSRVFCMTGSLHHGFVQSLEFALNNSITSKADIAGSACAALKSLAKYGFQQQEEGKSDVLWSNTMKHFLKVALEIFVMGDFDFDILDSAADALFCLICCSPPDYQTLVQNLIAKQEDIEVSKRLHETFVILTPQDLVLSPVEGSCSKFRRNFEVFIPKVKGLLFHK